MEPIIKVSGIDKFFGHTKILDNFSMEVFPGEVVTVIGPSGSGKSTLLRCLNGLEPIRKGHIVIDGMELDKKHLYEIRKKLGFVFQSFNLFPHLTVIENVVLAPRVINKEDKKVTKEYALSLLEQVGLADKADSYPNQLSGGQKQRVAIVRALAMRPKAILLDEITSALDPVLTNEVLGTVTQLAQAGLTMVIVTHEMSFARNVSKRIIYMEKGSIVEEGESAALFANPKDPRTKNFISNTIKE